MSMTEIIVDALRSVPPKLRQGMLLLLAGMALLLGAFRIVDFDVWGYIDNLERLLLYFGGYLGVQSAVNVSPDVSSSELDYEEVWGDGTD